MGGGAVRPGRCTGRLRSWRSCPPAVVTVTSTVPVPAGAVAVMVVELVTVNVVAGLLVPKSTAVDAR